MESITQLWTTVCEKYKKSPNYSDIAFSLWIECIEPKSFEENTLFVLVRTALQKQIIEKHYLSALTKCLSEIMDFDVTIEILLNPVPVKAPEDVQTCRPVSENQQKGGPGNGEYTFESFIVGDSNKFANAACHAVALNPASAYNPLFIYGNSGLGKTHLLFAICNEIRKNNPSANILYIKCEKFINEFISSISSKTTYEFQEKYRAADILLVDDIQFLTQKERTQEEFFHTFNALYHAGKQIVLTSDRPPKEIATLEDRLRTRFESGLIADVQPPDFETRVAIIRKKATSLNIVISDEIAEYLATKLKSNIRQIEGAVIKLGALVNLGGIKPSISVAQSFVKDLLNENQPTEVVVDKIITEVSRTFSVSVDDIKSRKKSAVISNARQMAIFIIKEITPLTMKEIGKYFGGKDHTTIVYTIQKIASKKKENPQYDVMINDIIKNVKEQ